MDPLQAGDPATVGRYRLEGRLNAGGMSQVYLGSSPGGRRVAVKLIRPDLADDPRFRARFRREVDAARRVGGFHTAQVVDADPDARSPWLVTAYIPGPSLGDLVRRYGPLEPGEVRGLGAGLAEGLAAIHDCGLIHRDVKPGNVIMSDDGPRIIDFGIARATDASALTSRGVAIGTFAFMSPEQLRAERVGAASDVFALGCVLAFAATGRSPFAAETIPAIVHRILSAEPRFDRLPADLGELIGGCLAKEPGERPGVREILARLTGGLGAGVVDPPRAAARGGRALDPTRRMSAVRGEGGARSASRGVPGPRLGSRSVPGARPGTGPGPGSGPGPAQSGSGSAPTAGSTVARQTPVPDVRPAVEAKRAPGPRPVPGARTPQRSGPGSRQSRAGRTAVGFVVTVIGVVIPFWAGAGNLRPVTGVGDAVPWAMLLGAGYATSYIGCHLALAGWLSQTAARWATRLGITGLYVWLAVWRLAG